MPAKIINKSIIWALIFIFFIATPLAFAERVPFICKPFNSVSPEKMNKAGPCFNKTLTSSETLNKVAVEDFIFFVQNSLPNEIVYFPSFILIVCNFSNFTPLRC